MGWLSIITMVTTLIHCYKVYTAGGKIAQGMVPAAERAVQLAGDVIKMWVDWGGGDDDAGR